MMTKEEKRQKWLLCSYASLHVFACRDMVAYAKYLQEAQTAFNDYHGAAQ